MKQLPKIRLSSAPIQFLLLVCLIFAGFALSFGSSSSEAKKAPAKTELVVYTSRKEHLIKPVFEAFEKEYPEIKIKYSTDKAGSLIQKLIAEKDKSLADILMTVDAGNLYRAETKGLFFSTESLVLEKRIPKAFRSSQNLWWGFSLRARTIFYNKDKVNPKDLSDYISLGDKKWNKRLCLRTSKKVYNQSLVASFIYHYGSEKTFKTLKNWVQRLARPVFSSDTKLLQAINNGSCHVGIANTYYYGRLVKKNQAPLVGIFWPNSSAHGVHINISGAGILKTSQNKKLALKFLEWLSQNKAQKLFADSNLEYPVVLGVAPDPTIQSWGFMKKDKVDLSDLGRLQVQAVKIMDRANYK